MTQGPDFTNPAQIAQRTITYDTDNMPVQVWTSQSGVMTYFSYDGDGDRVKKTIAGGATTYYVGDHYEVKNDEPLKYIFAGNLRLIMIKGTNTFYYHKDHLGSTSVMTNNSGAVVETAQYEPFGATRDHTGQDMSGYKFTDQELDNETNLYNYDARLYDPVIGRFGKADSVMQDAYDPQGLNAYSYCRNNPLIYTDPSGHEVEGGGGDKWKKFYKSLIIAGGTSKFVDPEHDNNAWNFLNAASLKAQGISKNDKNTDIKILMYTPGYERRAESEGRDLNYYVNIMSNSANKYGFDLITIRNKNELTAYLNNLKENQVENISYFGHSNNSKLFLEYNSIRPQVSVDYWGEAEAQNVDNKIFSSSASFNSYGCFQGEPGGLAERLHNLWGIKTSGAIGKTDYRPIGQLNWKPSGNYVEY